MAHLPRAVAAILLLGILGTAGPDPAVAQDQPPPAPNQPAAMQNQPTGGIMPDGAAAATGFALACRLFAEDDLVTDLEPETRERRDGHEIRTFGL